MNTRVGNTQSIQFTRRLGVAAILLASLLPGCGEQKYRSVPSVQGNLAPGTFQVPAKVDILIAEDDTGSMHEAYSELSTQLRSFMNDLQGRGWDYRLAVTPLVNRRNRNIDQIVGSKYDPNWGSQWIAPYPGANPGTVDSILTQYFRTPSNFGQFLTQADIDNGLNGMEPAFANIDRVLYQQSPNVGFLRPDAMLAIVVVGNGDDTSGVNYCPRSDGVMVYCNDGSAETSFANYKARFVNVKASPSLVRFYAGVSSAYRSSCRGGAAYFGSRYKAMENELTGAQDFDICTQSVTSILDKIGTNLQTARLSFRTRYLFIDKEPNPATIKVKKFFAGGGSVSLPESATNGWTYAGYLQDVYAIDSPVPMNRSSGYAIELHGDAKLIGADRAEITFTPKGFN